MWAILPHKASAANIEARNEQMRDARADGGAPYNVRATLDLKVHSS